MQDIAAKISDSELEVLEVLWEAEEALPIAPIRKLYNQDSFAPPVRERGGRGQKERVLLLSPCLEQGGLSAVVYPLADSEGLPGKCQRFGGQPGAGRSADRSGLR